MRTEKDEGTLFGQLLKAASKLLLMTGMTPSLSSYPDLREVALASSLVRLVVQECGPLATNCYLVHAGNEFVIIDPAINSDSMRAYAAELQASGVTFKQIWITHGHFDHVYDNAAWKAQFGVPILAHPKDEFFLEHLREQSIWFGLPAPEVVQADEDLSEGQELQVGEISCRVLEVPGHSPGSVAFAFDGWMVSGDVLFQGSVGRTDLRGCSVQDLAVSLQRLFALLPETLVFPGHGGETTIGVEQRSNGVARQVLAHL